MERRTVTRRAYDQPALLPSIERILLFIILPPAVSSSYAIEV